MGLKITPINGMQKIPPINRAKKYTPINRGQKIHCIKFICKKYTVLNYPTKNTLY